MATPPDLENEGIPPLPPDVGENKLLPSILLQPLLHRSLGAYGLLPPECFPSLTLNRDLSCKNIDLDRTDYPVPGPGLNTSGLASRKSNRK